MYPLRFDYRGLLPMVIKTAGRHMNFAFMGLRVTSTLVKAVTAPVCLYTAARKRRGTCRTDSLRISVAYATNFSLAFQGHGGGQEAGGLSTSQALPFPGVLWVFRDLSPLLIRRWHGRLPSEVQSGLHMAPTVSAFWVHRFRSHGQSL